VKLHVAFLPLLIWATASSAHADESAKELVKLQGAWSVATLQEGGKDQVDDNTKKLSIVIKEDIFSFKFAGQPKTLDMKLNLDPSSKPKGADLASTNRQGQVALGIYELREDELKICWSRNGKERPNDFKTNASDDRILMILKRLKTKEK